MKRNREHFDWMPDADGVALTWTRDRMTWQLYTQDTSTEPLTTFAWGRTLEDVGEVYDHEETFEGDVTQSDVTMSDRQLRLLGMPNRLVFQQMVKRLRVLARNKNRAALRRNPVPSVSRRVGTLTYSLIYVAPNQFDLAISGKQGGSNIGRYARVALVRGRTQTSMPLTRDEQVILDALVDEMEEMARR